MSAVEIDEPAYPVDELYNSSGVRQHYGLTMRDAFAQAALPALIPLFMAREFESYDAADMARTAYHIANRMMEARKL